MNVLRSLVGVCGSFALALCCGCSGGASPGPSPSNPSPTASYAGPCDILGTATATSMATPCVAAFSTVRLLSSSYSGPLYQVTRASDSTILNVATLPDGYANASSQDTFCANTTCVVTEIYDQSGSGNDLTVAPPGDAATGAGAGGYDVPAVANALPIMAGGHAVYGLSVVPGTGYRNDATKNIATMGQSEGVYMVTSTSQLVSGTKPKCCMDSAMQRLTIKYTFADQFKPFQMRYCTVKRDSGLLEGYARERAAVEMLGKAFAELERREVLSSWQRKDETGPRRKLNDVVFTVRPSLEFIRETKAANKRQQITRETVHQDALKARSIRHRQ